MKKSALSWCLLVVCSFATQATEVKIPQNVLDRHAQACPDFGADQSRNFSREVFLLPSHQFAPMGPKLFLLGCENYAYNTRSKAYLVDSYGTLSDVAVTQVELDGSFSATTDLMGAAFLLSTLQLTTYSKGRGAGDCGISVLYKYSPDTEKFVLVEERLKNECDGTDGPWPVVFPKK